MSLNDLKNLPLNERMQMMEILWESFVQEENLPTPKWHGEILEKRAALMKEGKVKNYTLDELRKKR